MYTTKSRFNRPNFDINQTVCWKMLSEDQCEEIYVTALELLERTGAQVASEEARSLFESKGCWVEGDMVRIPSAKLEWAVRTAPSRITLCDRSGKRAVLMETENNHFGPYFGSEKIVDRASGNPREITKNDVAETARLAEKLSRVNFVSAPGKPSDVSKKTAGLHALEAVLNNSTKPVIQPVSSAKEAEFAVNMAAAAVGGMRRLRQNPYLVLAIGCEEPRYHNEEALGAVMYAAKHGVPFVYMNKLISGVTAPTSTAGTLVLALANSLVALALSQFVAEGAPFISGGQFTIYDQKSATSPFGAPESGLLGTGFSNLMRHLRLPSAGILGVSDSNLSDAQSGAESTYGLLSAVLSGTNMIVSGGALESGKLASAAVLATSDEIVGNIQRIMKTFDMDEDYMARGVIDEIGPGGYYLGTDHTNVYFKSEQFWPNLINRKRIDDWMAAGSKTMGTRALEYVEELLSAPAASSLSSDAAAEISSILVKAEASL